MSDQQPNPPGAPGTSPKWTSSAKSGIGRACGDTSIPIFTISHGIIDEIYYPREDIASIRDTEFIVTDGEDFFSEEKRDTDHEVKWVREGIPAFKIVNTCKQKRYKIEKEIITDPGRDVVLQKVSFKPTKKDQSNYRLFLLLAPHLNNRGAHNDGWIRDYKGIPMLFANRAGITLAVACFYSNFIKRSVGYVGTSDGYTDLQQHKKMTWQYPMAHDGNIALTAEIDISKTCDFVIAIGFGAREEDAAHHAWASLLDGYDTAREAYMAGWKEFQKKLKSVKTDKNTIGKHFRASAAVLNIHQSKVFLGGVVASVSIPWGQTKGDEDQGGYHLVWPRDLVETSGGFLALDSKKEVLQILNYLMATQEDSGRWNQNMWLGGSPHWTAVQMDEIALPIILVEKCYQNKQLSSDRLDRYWPGIKKALSFIIVNGPATQQDRWEEIGGLTPFTLATEITALLCAAHLAEIDDNQEMATYCRETADYWNDQIEKWLYVTDTPLSQEVGVEGYYMRINRGYRPAQDVMNDVVYLPNRNHDNGRMQLFELICVDALALVRFGLRAANDPRMLNTVKVIDHKLRVETPNGPSWHRYPCDGYGEDQYGNPFPQNGNGIGRAWPLLTGERAHYEIAAGNIDTAKDLLKAIDNFSTNGLLPEQIWDTESIPEKELIFGEHSGSAMPLVWAHAEYIKLCHSIKQKKIFDISSHTEDRYIKKQTRSHLDVWRFGWPCESASTARTFRIELTTAAMVRWTTDNWKTHQDYDTRDTELGIHLVDIDLKGQQSEAIDFTFFWKDANHWENKNYRVPVVSSGDETQKDE